VRHFDYAAIAELLPAQPNLPVVRVSEFACGQPIPADAMPVGRRVKDMTGRRRVDVGVGDSLDPVAVAQDATQGAPHQPGRPDIYDESLALNERLEAFDEQRRNAPSLNPVAYGAKMAELEAKQRRRVALTDYDYFGRES
jgi:hypothetical protein